MNRIVLQLHLAMFGAACLCAAPAPIIPKANPLPLALDDAFEFRKTSRFVMDPKVGKPTTNEMINFNRQAAWYKAVSGVDRNERAGDYYNLYWRTKKPADVTVRFEYRQEKLNAYVQAQERAYPGARGTIESKFQVTGDDYFQSGRVIAWRALLIVDRKIVALNQSFLWD